VNSEVCTEAVITSAEKLLAAAALDEQPLYPTERGGQEKYQVSV